MKKMIPFTKFVALLVCVLGVGSAMAAWEGDTKIPRDTTINKTKYYLIENEENLAWFADSANRQAVNAKWNYLVDQINKLSLTDEKKADALKLMEAIRQDPYSYYSDEEKRALWSPYKSFLESARNQGSTINMNAIITANYLDMGGKQYTPIAAGHGEVKYTGIFNGNGVTIKNLEVNSDSFSMQFYDVVTGYPDYCQNVGMFGAIGSGGDSTTTDDADVSEVDLTITEVNGYSSSSANPKSYSIYTEALFNKVPSDLKGYNVRTTYLDENDTEIGFETETLSNIYYDSDYSLSFGYYTTYKKPNPDYVTVEIIKDGKTIDNFTQKIDQGKIKFLN